MFPTLTKHWNWTLHFVTGRIFIVDTVPTYVESDPDQLVIEHCDNIYEEMWRISINNPVNYLHIDSPNLF